MKALLTILIAGILFTSCNSIPKGEHHVKVSIDQSTDYTKWMNVPDSLGVGDHYNNSYGENVTILEVVSNN